MDHCEGYARLRKRNTTGKGYDQVGKSFLRPARPVTGSRVAGAFAITGVLFVKCEESFSYLPKHASQAIKES